MRLYVARARCHPVRDERCLLVPTIHSHPKHPIGTQGRGSGRPIAVPNLLNAEAQLVPERLGQRGPHDPLETIEPVAVVGKLVVLHDTPELLLVVGHDAVWRVVFHLWPVYRFAAAHVGSHFARATATGTRRLIAPLMERLVSSCMVPIS